MWRHLNNILIVLVLLSLSCKSHKASVFEIEGNGRNITSQLQKTIDKAAKGDTIFIKSGNYFLSRSGNDVRDYCIKITNKENLKIIGEGNTVIHLKEDDFGIMFYIRNCGSIQFENIQLVGNTKHKQKPTSGIMTDEIKSEIISNIKLKKIRLSNFFNGGINIESRKAHLENISVSNTGSFGIALRNTNHSLHESVFILTDIVINNCNSGLNLTGSTVPNALINATIRNLKIEYCGFTAESSNSFGAFKTACFIDLNVIGAVFRNNLNGFTTGQPVRKIVMKNIKSFHNKMYGLDFNKGGEYILSDIKVKHNDMSGINFGGNTVATNVTSKENHSIFTISEKSGKIVIDNFDFSDNSQGATIFSVNEAIFKNGVFKNNRKLSNSSFEIVSDADKIVLENVTANKGNCNNFILNRKENSSFEFINSNIKYQGQIVKNISKNIHSRIEEINDSKNKK